MSVRNLLAQEAYNRIKRDIIRLALAPSQRVTERELESRYALGRTPIREALARLVDQRLVRVWPRRGYLVASADTRDAHNLYSLRLLLETEAARLAAGHVDAQQLRELDDVCDAGYEPSDANSVDDFLRANSEFHLTIALASGNDRLAGSLAPVLDAMERLMHLGLRSRNRTNEMAHEHTSLVSALLAGDGDRASSIAADQIRASQQMVMTALLRAPLTDEVPNLRAV